MPFSIAGKQEFVPFCLPFSDLPLGCFPLPPASSLCSPPAHLTSFDVLHFTVVGNGEPMADKRGDSVTGSRRAARSQPADALPSSQTHRFGEAPWTPPQPRRSPSEGEGGSRGRVAVRSSA